MNDPVRAALRKYGRHLPFCSSEGTRIADFGAVTCDCGLSATLAGGVEQQPTRELPPTTVPDSGPWKIISADQVGSDDFTHDVWLKVSGDFGDDERRRVYMQWLCDALNRPSEDAAPARLEQPTDEQIARYLDTEAGVAERWQPPLREPVPREPTEAMLAAVNGMVYAREIWQRMYDAARGG